MKKLLPLNYSGKLTAYSAMAAGLTSAQLEGHAEIVYVDMEDAPVYFTQGYAFHFNWDVDSVTDLYFNVHGTNATSSSFVATVRGYDNYVMGINAGGNHFVSALEEGTIIGPDSPWLQDAMNDNKGVLLEYYFGDVDGNLSIGTYEILGVKFAIGGEPHYGWLRVKVSPDPAVLILYDYAYETNANQPIMAGATLAGLNIGESGTILSENAVQVFAANDQVTINQLQTLTNASVNIYDISGKCLIQQELTSTITHIDVTDLSFGNYFVLVRSAEGVLTKQLVY